ncbi:monosaccharide ABC transporter substrate-binding protein, CUT2 family [Agreia bicolorata]|uniref:Monosaccharide ABC transporter substrate-binding protein, CUT2 family n=1 Tax=Agreia bicolorata TaxID=110935 RepID=A0A1T4WRB3_9MICO|nr:TMAO reductase system periplasmic protein TorT [Agreia bicolorata]SKA79398.1 monosaccharide ABC transporter substrate-binding protein, CUT2 family [Agreia bicolorata]
MNGTRITSLAIAAIAAVALLSGCGAVGAASTSSDQPTADAVSADWTAPALMTAADGTATKGTYTPIPTSDVTEKWSVCVLFPHLKDPYWAATNYGTLEEAQRDGIDYQLFEAGGYENLSKQVSQMEDCITQKYDAIVLGAISGTGLCTQIQSALAAGIPVVDFINGTDCPESLANPLFSHAQVSFHDLAVTTGEYLKDHVKGAKTNVGFFPGPEGATWSDAAVTGFNDTVADSDVSIAVTRRGDTGKDVQLSLIEDSLKAYPDINAVVGVDIAADAAVVAVRNAGLQDKVDVFAFDIIPSVYEAILDGDAVGSPTDYTVVQGRMAIDQAVRMLEGQTLETPTVGPLPEMVTIDNAKSIPYSLMFAPKDFKATYQWSPAS